MRRLMLACRMSAAIYFQEPTGLRLEVARKSMPMFLILGDILEQRQAGFIGLVKDETVL